MINMNFLINAFNTPYCQMTGIQSILVGVIIGTLIAIIYSLYYQFLMKKYLD